jgi:4-aminobutyrate aminotransferase-like enzyme
VPHPAEAGSAATIVALRTEIARAGGPDGVLGIYIEPVQERTGRVVPADFWPRLAELRRDLGVPWIAVETASACYRSGAGAFASSGLPVSPDLLLWWGGAQTGYIHVATRWRAAEPLMMVSTWDGDELSLVREHHQLRAARHIDVAAAARALDDALARAPHLNPRGLGLYRVIDGDAALASSLLDVGVRLRALPNGCLAIAPPLDAAEEAAAALARALE